MRMRTGLGSLLLAAPLLAMAGDSLDVKLGLWEVSTTADVQGMMIPPEALKKMPPERRAQLLAAMKQNAGPHAHAGRSCITAEDIRQGAFRAEDDKDPGCKTKITAQTRTLQEANVVCTGEEARTSHIKIQALDREHVKGTIDNTTENGKVSVQITGKWVRATCTEADEK